MQVFEKIIEKLKEKKFSEDWVENVVSFEDATKVVNQVAEEYNNGWIPVSERLPEESNFYCATVEDTTTGGRCEQTVWFAHEDDYYGESEWRGLCNYEKVVAWKESAPYQPKGEQE